MEWAEIELPVALHDQLVEQASHHGLSLQDYIAQLLNMSDPDERTSESADQQP